MTPAAIAVAIAVPLAGWRLYMRMRRLRTRQRLGARRPWVNVVLTAVLVMVLGLIASSSPPAMAGLGVGVVAGGGLGLTLLGDLLRVDLSHPISSGGDGLRLDITTRALF